MTCKLFIHIGLIILFALGDRYIALYLVFSWILVITNTKEFEIVHIRGFFFFARERRNFQYRYGLEKTVEVWSDAMDENVSN